jgi:hypothetical protein
MLSHENGVDINIPVRIVMNNQTITAFSGFKFQDLRKSFVLRKARIMKASGIYKNCFEIFQTNENQASFCDFGMESTENYYNEWDYDFNLFKYQCFSRPETVNSTFARDLEGGLSTLKVNNLLDYNLFYSNH